MKQALKILIVKNIQIRLHIRVTLIRLIISPYLQVKSLGLPMLTSVSALIISSIILVKAYN